MCLKSDENVSVLHKQDVSFEKLSFAVARSKNVFRSRCYVSVRANS